MGLHPYLRSKGCGKMGGRRCAFPIVKISKKLEKVLDKTAPDVYNESRR